jgi:hypothetical protein
MVIIVVLVRIVCFAAAYKIKLKYGYNNEACSAVHYIHKHTHTHIYTHTHTHTYIYIYIYIHRSPDLTPLEFCLWVWMKSEVYRKKVDTRDELLVNILDVIACIKERQDALRRTTRHVFTRVAKCIDVDGGIFEHLL